MTMHFCRTLGFTISDINPKSNKLVLLMFLLLLEVLLAIVMFGKNSKVHIEIVNNHTKHNS